MFQNIKNIENKLTRFQVYPETELAYKYNTPLYTTQYSQLLVECEKSFDINTGKLIISQYPTYHNKNDENSYIPVPFLKNTGRTGGKLRSQDQSSTRLQELSHMNNTYFGAIHYGMKLDYKISRLFQEMSLSELETLHHLCELERTQILKSLALAVLKIPHAGYLLSGNRSNFIDKENILWYYTCTKKVSPLYVFDDKRCYKRTPIFYKKSTFCCHTF